jgi:hypothetical protein
VPFIPFLYGSTYPKYVVKDNKGNIAGAYGDNDWTPTNITEDRQVSLSDNIAVGPNLGCPQSAIVQSTGKEAPVAMMWCALRGASAVLCAVLTPGPGALAQPLSRQPLTALPAAMPRRLQSSSKDFRPACCSRSGARRAGAGIP